MIHPDLGRVRLNEAQARLVYETLHEAEKKALAEYVDHRDSPMPDPIGVSLMRKRARILEVARRKVGALIQEKGWEPPG